MTRIVANLYVTLDGVVEQAATWNLPQVVDEFVRAMQDQLAAADAMLLGRRTYESLASYWPHQGSEVCMADRMNEIPKYVVSATLQSVAWRNSTLIGGDVIAELHRLKRQPGRNLLIIGSATLVRSLLGHGIVDELRLQVHSNGRRSGRARRLE